MCVRACMVSKALLAQVLGARFQESLVSVDGWVTYLFSDMRKLFTSQVGGIDRKALDARARGLKLS